MRIVLGKMYELEMITEEAVPGCAGYRTGFPQDAADGFSDPDQFLFCRLCHRAGHRRPGREARIQQGYGLDCRLQLRPDDRDDHGPVIAVQDGSRPSRHQELFITDPGCLIAICRKSRTAAWSIIENKPNPGQIKAIVGGFGEKTGNFVLNRAVSAYRQPGSSIKPLDVYGPAHRHRQNYGRLSLHGHGAVPTIRTNRNALSEEQLFEGLQGQYDRARGAVTISCNTIAAQIWKNVLARRDFAAVPASRSASTGRRRTMSRSPWVVSTRA